MAGRVSAAWCNGLLLAFLVVAVRVLMGLEATYFA